MSPVQGHQLETQAYIRLLRSENSALRKQIEDSVEATVRAHSPELPTYDDVDLIDFLQRQCQELNAQRDILLAEVTKLKNTPCNDTAHADALERVSILSKQLSDARELGDKEKQLMRDHIQELEQAYCQHATEIEEERHPVEEFGWTLVQSSPRLKAFDLAAFVRDIWKHQVVIPKKYEGPFSDIEDLQVPKEADALMPHGYLSFSGAQIIWRSAGAELFVGLVPKQVAESIDGGRNIRWEDNIIQRHLGVRSAGQRREMLFLHNHTWHYYGQYECVGSVPLTAQQVEGLGYKKMIPYVIERTLIDSYGAVPRTKDRIFDQYSQGQLKIQCFAFKRVAFNEAFSKFLTKNGVWSSPLKS